MGLFALTIQTLSTKKSIAAYLKTMKNKTPESIREEVLKILEKILSVPRSDLHDDANFLLDLNAIDMESVDIALALEGDLGLYLSDSEAEKIKTVGDLCNWAGSKSANSDDPEQKS